MVDGKEVWIGGIVEGKTHETKTWPPLLPCRLFNMCSLETKKTNPELFAVAEQSMDYMLQNFSVDSSVIIREMSGIGIALANIGLAEVIPDILVAQINGINADKEYCYYDNNGRVPVFENRLTAREGVNAMSGQRLGNISAAIQAALLQSGGGSSSADPVLYLFPALPEKWNARFKLNAKGGFVVHASWEDGKIGLTEIESLLDARKTARAEKNWAEADRIRDRLSEMGIILEDTPQGIRWSRRSSQ
jgi:hypothetical protein